MSIATTPEIRKIVTFDEEVLIEGGKAAPMPWRSFAVAAIIKNPWVCLLYTSPSPRDRQKSRMPSSA